MSARCIVFVALLLLLASLIYESIYSLSSGFEAYALAQQSKKGGDATPQLTIPESNVGGTSAGLVGRQFHVEVCNNSVDDDNDGTVDEGSCSGKIPTGPFSRHDAESPLVAAIRTEPEVEIMPTLLLTPAVLPFTPEVEVTSKCPCCRHNKFF